MAWDFNDSDKRRRTSPQTKFVFGALVVVGALSLLYPALVYLVG